MAQHVVNIGTVANDGTGDTLRVAFAKVNEDIAELFAIGGSSSETGASILAKLTTVDGAGSGLDADLLDGLSSTAFALASHTHVIADVTGLQAALDAKAAVAHTHAQSDVTGLAAALALKLDASAYTAADVLTKIKTVDGAGSGLDADLLDGLSSAAFAAASHSHDIADVTGLQAALDGKGDLSSAASVSVDSEVAVFSGTTGKLIKRATGTGLATLAAGVLSVTDPATFAAAAHTHAQSDVTGLTAALADKLDASAYTAADVLSKLLTVDGTGSGLDADTLDGLSSASFAAASHTHAQSEVTGLTAALAAKLDASSYTAADVLAKLLTVDGTGSGLDADLLDGLSSAAFAAASHAHAAADVTSGVFASALLDGTWPDNTELHVGTGNDLRVFHDGTNTFLRNDTGHIFVGLATSTTPVNLDATASLTTLAQRLTFAALDSANFDFISYGTSYTSPVAPASSATLGSFRFRAHDSTAIRTVARMTATASQTWTAGSAYGTSLGLANTATGATSAVVRLSLVDDQVQMTFGTASLPGITFLTDADTGFYRAAANIIGMSVGGAEAARVVSSGLQTVDGTLGAPAYSFASDTNTGIYLSAADEITLGTGNARRMIWDANGRVLAGAITSSVQVGPTTAATVQIGAGTGAGFSVARYSADSTPPVFVMGKSRGPGLGAFGIITSGDTLARIQFAGADGTDFQTLGAEIKVVNTGSPAADSIAAQIEFYTSSGSTLAEALRLNSAGLALFRDGGAANPAVSFINDADCGMYRVSANVIAFAVNATEVLRVESSSISISGSVPAFRLNETDAATDEGVWRTDVNSNVYRIRAYNDSLSLNAIACAITRGSGSTPSITDVTIGNATDNTTANFPGTGTKTFGGAIRGADGTVALPGLSFSSDSDCGIYRIAANQLGIAANGTLVLDIATGLFAITATTVRLNTTTASTVGAAGGASALPATPLGYLSVNVGGTAAKIPYYNT